MFDNGSNHPGHRASVDAGVWSFEGDEAPADSA
jgi:hypothetical protein